MPRFWLAAGAINMLLALAIAAGTGHPPPSEFVALARNTLDTAREMHFVHALGLIFVGIVSAKFGRTQIFDLAGGAFLAGIACFCGGIYAAYLLDATALKFLVPLGGVAFMRGWASFAAAALFPKVRT